MKRINVLQILENELDIEENYKNKVANMSGEDYETYFVGEMIADFVEEYITPKINELINNGVVKYDDDIDNLCFDLLKEFMCSDEKKREYIDFLNTDNKLVKEDIANKVCDFVICRQNIEGSINDFIRSYLMNRLVDCDMDYNMQADDTDINLLSKFVFYLVLSFFDKERLYVSGLCYNELYNNFLLNDDVEEKEHKADMILKIVVENKDDYLEQIDMIKKDFGGDIIDCDLKLLANNYIE